MASKAKLTKCDKHVPSNLESFPGLQAILSLKRERSFAVAHRNPPPHPPHPPQGGCAQWQIIGVGRLDSGNKADIVFRHSTTNEVYAWYMNGTTLVSGQTFGSQDQSWVAKGARDFDGSLGIDLLWHQPSSGKYSVWLMSSGGTKQIFEVGSAPSGTSFGGFLKKP